MSRLEPHPAPRLASRLAPRGSGALGWLLLAAVGCSQGAEVEGIHNPFLGESERPGITGADDEEETEGGTLDGADSGDEAAETADTDDEDRKSVV